MCVCVFVKERRKNNWPASARVFCVCSHFINHAIMQYPCMNNVRIIRKQCNHIYSHFFRSNTSRTPQERRESRPENARKSRRERPEERPENAPRTPESRTENAPKNAPRTPRRTPRERPENKPMNNILILSEQKKNQSEDVLNLLCDHSLPDAHNFRTSMHASASL